MFSQLNWKYWKFCIWIQKETQAEVKHQDCILQHHIWCRTNIKALLLYLWLMPKFLDNDFTPLLEFHLNLPCETSFFIPDSHVINNPENPLEIQKNSTFSPLLTASHTPAWGCCHWLAGKCDITKGRFSALSFILAHTLKKKNKEISSIKKKFKMDFYHFWKVQRQDTHKIWHNITQMYNLLHKSISQSSFSTTISKRTKLDSFLTHWWRFFVFVFYHTSNHRRALPGLLTCEDEKFPEQVHILLECFFSNIEPTPIVHVEKHTVVPFVVMLCWLHVADVWVGSTGLPWHRRVNKRQRHKFNKGKLHYTPLTRD